jgi:hypothetical protein
MPLDVLGGTRATIRWGEGCVPERVCESGDQCVTGIRDWKFCMNEECLVSAEEQTVLNTSLSFVLTARRYFR